ncbi:MAG: hypothetical protein KDI19_00025 [Pseudomonadales bacterium]|nr:hypothetical protein [Pseudomonadales bacterium]
MALTCWNCDASLDDVPRPISRHANCPACFEVLHCCRLCRHYRPGAPGQCDHDLADPPVEKASANFCDFFSPTAGAFNADHDDRRAAARTRAASLFGEDEPEGEGDESDSAGPGVDQDHEDSIKSRLDDLFKD